MAFSRDVSDPPSPKSARRNPRTPRDYLPPGANPRAIGTERDLVALFQGQQLAVTPERRRTRGEIGKPEANRAEIVVDPQRHAAALTDAQQGTRIVAGFAGEAMHAAEELRQSGCQV